MHLRYLSLMLVVLCGPALAGVTVNFVNTEKYTDASPENNQLESGRLSLQNRLRAYLQTLARRYLPDDRALAVEISDIDLAGQFEPWRPEADTVRFFRRTTWPSIKLRYSLKDATRAVVSSGEEVVSDPYYLELPNRYPVSDTLRYEKPMLEKWFRERFAGQSPAPPR